MIFDLLRRCDAAQARTGSFYDWVARSGKTWWDKRLENECVTAACRVVHAIRRVLPFAQSRLIKANQSKSKRQRANVAPRRVFSGRSPGRESPGYRRYIAPRWVQAGRGVWSPGLSKLIKANPSGSKRVEIGPCRHVSPLPKPVQQRRIPKRKRLAETSQKQRLASTGSR